MATKPRQSSVWTGFVTFRSGRADVLTCTPNLGSRADRAVTDALVAGGNEPTGRRGAAKGLAGRIGSARGKAAGHFLRSVHRAAEVQCRGRERSGSRCQDVGQRHLGSGRGKRRGCQGSGAPGGQGGQGQEQQKTQGSHSHLHLLRLSSFSGNSRYVSVDY